MNYTNKKNRPSRNRVIVTNNDPSFKIKKKSASQIALKALNSVRFSHIRVNLIFTTDSQIKRINRQFLNHNWPTDVLAFPLSQSFGEVIISPKTAKAQAPLYQATFKEELARYICHGILHLAGFKDKTEKEKNAMRHKEDRILKHSRRFIQRII